MNVLIRRAADHLLAERYGTTLRSIFKTKDDEKKYEDEILHPDPTISKAEVLEKDGEVRLRVTKVSLRQILFWLGPTIGQKDSQNNRGEKR